MKPVTLPSTHYAYAWKSEVHPVAEVNQIGLRYAKCAAGPEKEVLLLDLCRCFHGYLMKYLVMICMGDVPLWGMNTHKGCINKDVKPFLLFFLPKGSPVNRETLTKVVRHLHLAFKGMDAEEIYGVLTEQLVAAVARYDPDYTGKVKLVAEVLDHELSEQEQFTVAELNNHVEFDCDRYVRLLCRRGYLEPPGRARQALLTSAPPLPA